MKNKFYITTPIYYVNNVPHIGSTYTTVAADVLARYHRMIGNKTFFLTGTDEHGAKIEATAKKSGKEPQQFVDEIAAKFQFAWDELNIANDNFIRTTNPKHIKAVQKALQYMYDKGDIYLGKYEGLYCRGCEQYKSERDLVDGKCPDHNIAPEKMSEECYMFKLSAYQERLRKLIEKDEFKIRPENRKNEILSFYKEGLQDISFSRKNIKWGVPMSWNKNYTAYVWADAFLNYLTGLGWDGTGGRAPEFWPADVHLMSKDILRVHATIWPAMLLSLDLPLPKQLFIHGYFLINGQKMSKSFGNVITPEDLVKKYGVDGARYLLISAITFGHDGDVGWDKFDEKYNADLANGLGNLIARSITLVEKMQNAKIKMQNTDENLQFAICNPSAGSGQVLQTILNNQFSINKVNITTKNVWEKYKEKFLSIGLDRVIELINLQIKFLDLFITTTKPWELIKNKDERVGVVMYNILERIRHIAWMIWPFMPETAEKIWQRLGLDASKEMEKDFDEAIKWGGLKPDTQVEKGEPLFPRI